jgi:hypothetical protein
MHQIAAMMVEDTTVNNQNELLSRRVGKPDFGRFSDGDPGGSPNKDAQL